MYGDFCFEYYVVYFGIDYYVVDDSCFIYVFLIEERRRVGL